MKKLILVLSIVFLFSCSKPEIENKNASEAQCNCVKTFYIYHPAMGSGPSYIPAYYEVKNIQPGVYNCNEDTGLYVPYYTNGSTHYKIDCD